MITMHYSFTLPADYDMVIIQRRIRDNGHKLNGFPHLVFKAYLYALKDSEHHQTNQYAPFYLWQTQEGVSRFLSTSGYQQLELDFGRPVIESAIPIAKYVSDRLQQASLCKKEVFSISCETDIGALIQEESDIAEGMSNTDEGCLVGFISTLNPEKWQLTRWSLCSEDFPAITNEHTSIDTQWFHVGYVAS